MLLSLSNRKYATFPSLCFSVVVCLRCLLQHHILSLIAYTIRGNGNFFSLLLCSLWWVPIVGYFLACRSYSFICKVNYLIIINVQTYQETLVLYEMHVRYILSSVWVRLSIFSQLSILQYVGLCVFSLPISLVMIERIYILCLIIIIKSEIWTINHCLWLDHETMVCAVCLSIYLYHGL